MPTPLAGALRDVVIGNITATGAKWPSVVAGIPGHAIEGVTLSNFRIANRGGGTREEGRVEVPENVAKYPSADMFETYPAGGLYCRHAADLRISAFDLRCESPDFRPTVVCEDVARLAIDSLAAPADGSPVIALRNARTAIVRGCVPVAGTKEFLSVSGKESTGISLLANDFSGVDKVVELSRGALPDSVGEVGNRR
jgi:hypothetical protein